MKSCRKLSCEMKWNVYRRNQSKPKKENVIVTNRERERDRLGAADRKTGRGAVIEEGLKLES